MTISIVVVLLFGVPFCINGEEILVKPPDITKDKEVICDAIQKVDNEIKVDIDGMMDYDDLLRLTVWNSKYNLRSGTKKFNFPEEVNWKRDILKHLGSIFTKVCPRQFVDPEFINAAIELFMIYQNSVNGSENHKDSWHTINPVLHLCHSKIKMLNMTSSGYEVTGLIVQIEGGGTQEVAILTPQELADASKDLDLIIDTIWWIFSLSFGSCYWSAESPSFWAARFKRMFYGDFLHSLKKRWLHAGPNTDFGVIFGDFPYKIIQSNIRKCVTAAYTSNGLADRQLVRSLTLASSGMGIEAGLNKKLGKTL